MLRTILAVAVGLFLGWSSASAVAPPAEDLEHGGGLNKCGCHVNHKTGECHCHQDRGCQHC
jgi:hypothetical protein